MEELGAFEFSRIVYLGEMETETRNKQNLTRSNLHLLFCGACATVCNVYVCVRVRGSNSKSSLTRKSGGGTRAFEKKLSVLCLAEHAVSYYKINYHNGTTKLDVHVHILCV